MILSILLLATVLRLINLNQSLWLDEAINVLAAKNNTFWGMINEYAKYDFHPPGYFVILWLWSKVFGYAEVAVRLPSVIFGVATVFIAYLVGWKLHSKLLGVIAALLLSINPLHIYYSQEARMYTFATFTVALNFFYFTLGVLAKPPPRWIIVFSNLLVFLSDYLAYLIFPAQFIFILLIKNKKLLKNWLVSFIVAASFFIWWAPIFFEQLKIGQTTVLNIPAWRVIVGSFGLKPLVLTFVKFIIGRIDHPNNLVYGLLFLPAGGIFLYLVWRALTFSDNLVRRILLTWLVIPIFFTLLISLLIPIYSYFRLLFVIPTFLLLISYGIISFKKGFKLIITIVFLIQIIAASIYLFNPIFHREDWKGLVNFLRSNPENSKILFESNGSFAPFEYYGNDQVRGVGALKNFPATSQFDLIDLKSELNGVMNIYLVDYLVQLSDPQRLVGEKLIELGYKHKGIKNFNGVGFVYHFEK